MSNISTIIKTNKDTLKLGMIGDNVRLAQLAMAEKGYKLKGTGYFGNATDTAVEAVQRKAGIKIDGEIGPITANVIDKLPASSLIPTLDHMEITRPLWLEAGLRYLGTKEFAGGKDNPVIIDWAKEEGDSIAEQYTHDSIPWCFTGETEILTADGFKRLDAIIDGERVFQADSDGNLSIANSKKIEKEYDGDVFDINHTSIKLTCDIGHRWFGAWGSRDRSNYFKSLEDLNTAGLTIPAVKSNSVGVNLTDDELRFVAAFISDGKERKAYKKEWSIDFEVSKPRKITALTLLSPLHTYTQKKTYGALTKIPLTVFRFAFPEYFNSIFEDYKILSRTFIQALSQRQARLFIEAYSIFDGDGKATTLYTSDIRIRDNLITIILMAGAYPSVTKTTGSKLSKKQPYKIKFSFSKTTRKIEPRHVKRRHFSGKLYCVSVPEQRIIVRGKNGTPILTGNCALFANHILTKVGLKGTETLWALDFAGKWPCVRLAGPAVGAFAPMKRNGGGHIMVIVGRDQLGNIMGLGGNQSDAVTIAPFAVSRLNQGFYWPKGPSLPPYVGLRSLPIVKSNGKVSTNEE